MLVNSDYQSPFPINNGHLETVIPYFLRQLKTLPYQRERIETEDFDFLDIDWVKNGNDRLVVLSHGLEGCSESNYISGMGRELMTKGYDILAWNNRGCSGETNRLLKMYHSGASFDLRRVLEHVFETTAYDHIDLVGFSMGGNISLKYLGEEGEAVDSRIKKAVAVSAPISLEDCAVALSQGVSRAYSRHFINRMIKKLRVKDEMFPEFNPDFKQLQKMWDFESFDNSITAPINGFKDAKDYWQKASSLFFLPDIKVKSLVINALNDPFLRKRCFPMDELKNHPFVDLELPERGGHVGFFEKSMARTWLEKRVSGFLTS